jgi:enamine deaminase RidA (YjgF/YER057c/UK114 family)
MADSYRRTLIRSGAPWEPLVGYARAVRVGPFVSVSGCASVGSEGELIGEGDAYAQASRCIEVIRDALEAAGAGLEHVVRTRMFVTDIEQWPEIGKAHQEAFGNISPATSMVEVSRLIDPGMLVEIEADAIVDEGQAL